MKSVLLSTKPKYCESIASGKKRAEIRKTKPKLSTPFKCYIYMTAGSASYPVIINGHFYTCHNNGGKAVIGEFICDDIAYRSANHFIVKEDGENALKETCLTSKELYNYLGWKNGIARIDCKPFYTWHISELKIYDKPKNLSEFNLSRPPQSWCYVEELIHNGEIY